jgi:hypothetical protein
MLNQLEFAISIMNAHFKSNTPIIKVLSNQLGIFMMRIVAGRFARHVRIRIGDCLDSSMMRIVEMADSPATIMNTHK